MQAENHCSRITASSLIDYTYRIAVHIVGSRLESITIIARRNICFQCLPGISNSGRFNGMMIVTIFNINDYAYFTYSPDYNTLQ